MRLESTVFLEVVKHTPLVSIDLILRDPQGRVLLGLRNNEPAAGWWFVPGGRICKNERIDAALVRILRKETAIERGTDQARFLGVYEHLYDENFAGAEGIGTHYVVLGYDLAVDDPARVRTDDQHRDHRWLHPDRLVEDPKVHPHAKAYFLPR